MTSHWDWFSVGVYCLVAFFGVLCLKYANISNTKKRKRQFYCAWLVVWVIIASFRAYGYRFGGTDTIKYVTFFELINSPSLPGYYKHYDAGYWALNWFVRIFTSNVRIYFLVYYSILVYCYIKFFDSYIQKKTYYVSFFLMFFLYLRAFASMRTNISVGFILLALVALKDKKNIKCVVFLIVACLMHKATILYAGSVVFYWMNEKKPIKVKSSIIFAILAGGVGTITRKYIGLFFNSDVDAYAGYAQRSVGASFFDNFWKIVFGQLVLLVVMVIFNKKILNGMAELDNENKNRINIIRTLCAYDFVIIPITFTLSIWRGPEYLYFVRLIMWGYIFEILGNKYFSKNSRIFVNILLYVVFVAWFIFRLEATWEASSLLPYVFSIH